MVVAKARLGRNLGGCEGLDLGTRKRSLDSTARQLVARIMNMNREEKERGRGRVAA